MERRRAKDWRGGDESGETRGKTRGERGGDGEYGCNGGLGEGSCEADEGLEDMAEALAGWGRERGAGLLVVEGVLL